MRYKIFIKTVHIPTHAIGKYHNYYYMHANDMILKPNYSKQSYLY